VTGSLQVLTKPSAPAAVALNTEDELRVANALGPALQLQIAGGSGRERELAEQLSKHVERHGVMALLVGIHSDCDHRFLLVI